MVPFLLLHLFFSSVCLCLASSVPFSSPPVSLIPQAGSSRFQWRVLSSLSPSPIVLCRHVILLPLCHNIDQFLPIQQSFPDPSLSLKLHTSTLHIASLLSLALSGLSMMLACMLIASFFSTSWHIHCKTCSGHLVCGQT